MESSPPTHAPVRKCAAIKKLDHTAARRRRGGHRRCENARSSWRSRCWEIRLALGHETLGESPPDRYAIHYRIGRTAGRQDRGITGVEICHIVELTVGIDYRLGRIVTHTERPGLMERGAKTIRRDAGSMGGHAEHILGYIVDRLVHLRHQCLSGGTGEVHARAWHSIFIGPSRQRHL